ncbi:MAG: glycosyltransferase family 2 protein [Planctomycetota bacterium]
MHKISIVVAAYNENSIISETIQKIIELMKQQNKYEWELICVDDGSCDDTYSVAIQTAAGEPKVKILKHNHNYGQGRALRTGFAACSGDIVVTIDADLSYGPEYILKLGDVLIERNVDITLASPYAKGGEVVNVPFYRRLLSRFGNKYLAKMSQYNISTITCVVRAYRREILDAIFLTSDGMELQLEIMLKAAMIKARVCEIPARLAWAKQKSADMKFSRVSKMRIFRTMGVYLFLGWLSKPAYFFILLSLSLLLTGGYMAFMLVLRTFNSIITNLDYGAFQAISIGLETVYKNYTYSFIISGGLIIFGFHILGVALLTIQNKFYFEEMYKLTEAVLSEKIKKSEE